MYYILHAEKSAIIDIVAEPPDAQQLANHYGCGILVIEGKEIARAWPDPGIEPAVDLSEFPD